MLPISRCALAVRRRFNPARYLSLVAAMAVGVSADAAVTGTVHINTGTSFQNIGLVPDQTFNFSAPADPQLTTTFQQSLNNGLFGRKATATVDGHEGTLSAYADAEVKGVPNANTGIYAEASLLGTDVFEVKSNTLARGAPVELDFELAISGNGPVFSKFQVLGGLLFLSYNDPGTGPGTSSFLDNTRGSFIAKVGDSYGIEYTLKASAFASIFNLANEPNQTRFLASDYANTAHFFAQSATEGAFIVAQSGHDFTKPAPVPLPMSGVLLVSGLAVLRRFTKSREIEI